MKQKALRANDAHTRGKKDGEKMVRINGMDVDAAGMTVIEYLEKNDYTMNRIAIEKDGEILPKSQYESALLADGDALEIVSFVGGG